MRRREFVGLIGSMAAAWPFSTRAQQTAMPVIGFLHYGSPEAYAHVASAVRQGLRESGFIEGQNVAVEFRWADGQYERLPALASELVERHVLAIAARIDAGPVSHSPILLGNTLLTKAAWRPSSSLGKVMQGTLGEGLIPSLPKCPNSVRAISPRTGWLALCESPR